MTQPTLFDAFQTPDGATIYRHEPATTLATEDDLDEKFATWIEANANVLDVFCEYALTARKRGARRIGAKQIVENMRWDLRLQTSGDPFKMNNSYTSRLARAAVARHPELTGMIEFRNLRT